MAGWLNASAAVLSSAGAPPLTKDAPRAQFGNSNDALRWIMD